MAHSCRSIKAASQAFDRSAAFFLPAPPARRGWLAAGGRLWACSGGGCAAVFGAAPPARRGWLAAGGRLWACSAGGARLILSPRGRRAAPTAPASAAPASRCWGGPRWRFWGGGGARFSAPRPRCPPCVAGGALGSAFGGVGGGGFPRRARRAPLKGPWVGLPGGWGARIFVRPARDVTAAGGSSGGPCVPAGVVQFWLSRHRRSATS